MMPPQAYCKPPMYSGVPMAAPPDFMLATVWMAAMKAKLEPRNAGTLRLVTRWKKMVPRPAANRATEVSRPVRMGTSTVEPNMANTCWMPRVMSLPQDCCWAGAVCLATEGCDI